jgi:hypothetical protein
MKALDPQRLHMVLYFFLQLLFLVAFFVAIHMKARMGVVLPCAIGVVLFLFLALRAGYNLTSD